MNFNIKISTTVISLFFALNLFSQKQKVYGFYPLWDNKQNQSNRVDSFSSAFRNSLLDLFKHSKKKPIVLENLSKLIEYLESSESSDKNASDANCVIGFYFFDENKKIVLDIFRFNRQSMTIYSCQKVEISIDSQNYDFTNIIKMLNENHPYYQADERKNLLFQYLLPYQAEYYSTHVYSVDLDSVKKSRIDFSKEMKVNGKIKGKSLFNEIEKLLNSKSIPKVFRDSDCGILDLLDNNKCKGLKYDKYRKKYKDFFSTRPILETYIRAAEAYTKYNRLPVNVSTKTKTEHRKTFENKLTIFLDTVDSGISNEKESIFFEKNRRIILEIRNEFVIRANHILKCSENKKDAEQALKDSLIDKAISNYYNVIKFCGGLDNYNQLKSLFSSRDSIYKNLIEKSNNEKKSGNYKNSIKLLLQAEKISPHVPSTRYKINEVEKLLIESNKALPLDKQFEANTDLKMQILENQLSTMVSNSYKYKVIDRSITINRTGQTITIKFTPKSSGLNMVAEISYYPIGKFTYDFEEVENDLIINAIHSISNLLSTTDEKGEVLIPFTELILTGSADLTKFKGAVAVPDEYSSLDVIVPPCDKELQEKSLQELRKSEANAKEKNLALAYLRAYHKQQKILSKCGSKISKYSLCARVIEGGGTKYRSVLVTIQVTLNPKLN
jgi:hypothetical protein